MLCYSTGSLPPACTEVDTPADALAFWLLPTPFRGIEWVIRPGHLAKAHDRSLWQALRISLEARGFSLRNVHLGFPFLLSEEAHKPGLSSLLPFGREKRRQAALAAMRIAEALGSPHVTFTAGMAERSGGHAMRPSGKDAFARPSPPLAQGARSPDFREQERAFLEELAVLVAHKPKGLRILIEQEPEMVIHGAAQLLALGQAFPGEVFANYDVGHAAVIVENPAEALLTLGALTRNVHLEDIAGQEHRHLLYGEGDIDFAAIFAALRAMGYAGDITPDLYPFCDQPQQGLSASMALLAKQGWL